MIIPPVNIVLLYHPPLILFCLHLKVGEENGGLEVVSVAQFSDLQQAANPGILNLV